MKNLEETISLMTSKDYKERFKAEYWQLKIRYNKLCEIINKAERKQLQFTLNCPLNLLIHQRDVMEAYLYILENRAESEGVEL